MDGLGNNGLNEKNRYNNPMGKGTFPDKGVLKPVQDRGRYDPQGQRTTARKYANSYSENKPDGAVSMNEIFQAEAGKSLNDLSPKKQGATMIEAYNAVRKGRPRSKEMLEFYIEHVEANGTYATPKVQKRIKVAEKYLALQEKAKNNKNGEASKPEPTQEAIDAANAAMEALLLEEDSKPAASTAKPKKKKNKKK